MKDNLEDFIRSNRADFDMESPDLKVWAGIDNNLGKNQRPRRVSLWRNFAAAASVLILLGLGTLIGMQINQQDTARQSLADVSLEHQELQQYYEVQLKEKKALLASHHSDPTVYEDLQQLESFLEELKGELQAAPKDSEEQIVRAMIENYQDRLEILERVLSRVKSGSTEPQKLKKDETINL